MGKHRCNCGSTAHSLRIRLFDCRSGDISLKTLPAVGTVAYLRIGLFGDLGDTLNSSDTLNHLQGNNPDIVYNVGDLVSFKRVCEPSISM